MRYENVNDNETVIASMRSEGKVYRTRTSPPLDIPLHTVEITQKEYRDLLLAKELLENAKRAILDITTNL